MPSRARSKTDDVDEEPIEGTATEVHGNGRSAGNDQDVIDELERERAARGIVVHSARPQRQLILSNEDRMTMHGLIVAQLGEQGRNVTPAEFDYFLRVCELRGLNPLFREAHFIKDGEGRITVQTGIDGFRKLAEDTGEYRGQTGAEWGPIYDGEQPEWLGKPGYVKVGVHREGFVEPLFGEAWLEEDGQVGRDGRAIGQWAKRPRTMLRKVAEARALRAGFPRQMAGLYTDDEIPEPRQVGEGEGRPVGQLAPTAPQPTGAPEPAATVSEGTWRPPEPPPTPEGALQGVATEVPELRRVRPDSALSEKYGLRGILNDKVELKMKVSNRNHTAIILGDLAKPVAELEIKVGEVVALQGGTVHEVTWSTDETKPKKKEVWGVTAVSVMRDGAWVEAVAQPGLPLEEAAALAAAVPTSSAPAAEPTPPAAATPTPSPTSSPGSSASADADVPPGYDAPPEAPAWLERTEGAQAGPLELRVTEPIRFSEAAGRRFGALRTVARSGEIVSVVVGNDPEGELEAILGTNENPAFTTDSEIIVLGFWKNNWIVASAVGTKPL